MRSRKRIIILEHGGGELSNQLWNFISIYAHCCQQGYNLENYSFSEYAPWFKIPLKKPLLFIFFFFPFWVLEKLGGYETVAASFLFRALKKYIRFVYGWYAAAIKVLYTDRIVSSDSGVIRLDNTALQNPFEKILAHHASAYGTGWLFRNYTGMKTYRKEIQEYFEPQEKHKRKASALVNGCREKYRYIIGVHIRQRNQWDTRVSFEEDCEAWKTYAAKPFFYPLHFSFVRVFLKSYCDFFHKYPNETCFVICSNKSVPEEDFPGMHCVLSKGNCIEDMLTLASCDCVIGSDSTLSALSSWWGDLPLIAMQENPDWGYYTDKKGYFENKYVTAVHY